MLIVCTQDQAIREVATNPAKGGQAWAPVELLPPGIQPDAKFAEILRNLPVNQPLCLAAHGNDTEIGDEVGGWSWSTRRMAALLAKNVNYTWRGPVLIYACAKTVANFSAGLVVALQEVPAFRGLWCYGFNRAITTAYGFPDPANMDGSPLLQAAEVRY